MDSSKCTPYTSILLNKKVPSDDTLVQLEKYSLIMFRHTSEANAKVYQNFDDQLSTYLGKISGPSKDAVFQLLNRKALLISQNSKKN